MVEYKKCLDLFKNCNNILKKIGYDEFLDEVSFRAAGKYILNIKSTTGDVSLRAVVPNCKANLGSSILTFIIPRELQSSFNTLVTTPAGNYVVDGVEFFRFLKNFKLKSISLFQINKDGIKISDGETTETMNFSPFPPDIFIKKGVFNPDKYPVLDTLNLDYEFLTDSDTNDEDDDQSNSFLSYLAIDTKNQISKISLEDSANESYKHIITFSPKIFPKLSKKDTIVLTVRKFIDHPINKLNLACFKIDSKNFVLNYSFIIIDK